MSGKYITKQQVELYMKYKAKTDLNQASCGAKAGFSERTARSIDNGVHHTQHPRKVRLYKTRKSPLDEIWKNELKPMLHENPQLQPTTLFIHLERIYQNSDGSPLYSESCLRTLQRKVSYWKATHGPNKDIIVPQQHFPGVQSLSDFTNMNDFDIKISGRCFPHLLYHFRLVFSKWSYAKIIQGGESFQALSEGVQEALIQLGGSPKEHRTDSLSAAYKNRHDETEEDLTERYENFCKFYNMVPTRNNKGVSHENGSVESSHGHLKNRIKQELLLRGNSEFKSVEDYEVWVQQIVLNSNRRNSKNFNLEKQSLQPLPIHKTMDYELISTKISSLSMMIIRNMTYSVPSRLAGHTITIHLHQKRIVGFLGGGKVLDINRKYSNQQSSRYVINYCHLIHALIKKPRAFRHCRYRDELLPNDIYRSIWQHLTNTMPYDVAPKVMLRLLKLSADYDCESALGEKVMRLINQQQLIVIESLESEYNNSNPALPTVRCKQHSLQGYDHLIAADSNNSNNYGVNHATI